MATKTTCHAAEEDSEENEQDIVINKDATHRNSELSLPEPIATIHQPQTIMTEMKVEEDYLSLNQLKITIDKEEAQCLRESNSSSLQPTPCPDENHQEMVDVCASSGPPMAVPSPTVQHEGDGGSEKKDIVVGAIAAAAAQPTPSNVPADNFLQKNNDLLRSLHLEKEMRLSNVAAQIEQEAQQTDPNNSFITSIFQQHSTSDAKKISSSSRKKKKKVKSREKGNDNKTCKGQQKQQDCSASSPPMMNEIEDDMEFLTRESERVSHEQPAYHRVLNVTEAAMRAANPSWDPYYQPPAKSCMSTSERNKMSKNLGRKLQDLKEHRNIAPRKTKNR